LAERIIEIVAGLSAGMYVTLEKTGVANTRSFDWFQDQSGDGLPAGPNANGG
jgi:hypothetical protein